MAQKFSVQLIDDLDGTQAAETVRFELDGVSYEIDLTGEHAAQLRGILAEYIPAARRVGGRLRRTPAPSTQAADESAPVVRVWANSNGFALSERGRIPGGVLEAYRAAHKPRTPKPPKQVADAVKAGRAAARGDKPGVPAFSGTGKTTTTRGAKTAARKKRNARA